MHTDPVVTVIFFAIAFLVFCGIAAALDARYERRTKWLIREHNRRLRREGDSR